MGDCRREGGIVGNGDSVGVASKPKPAKAEGSVDRVTRELGQGLLLPAQTRQKSVQNPLVKGLGSVLHQVGRDHTTEEDDAGKNTGTQEDESDLGGQFVVAE
jgi:hypothetical protein